MYPAFLSGRQKFIIMNVLHLREPIPHLSFMGLTCFHKITSRICIGNLSLRLQNYRMINKLSGELFPHSILLLYLLCLQHHCTAKYAVEFERELYTSGKDMWDTEIPVIIPITSPISRLNSGQANPELCSAALYRSGTNLTHNNNRHPKSTRLWYLTGWLAGVENLNVTTYLGVGHLSTLLYIYILGEVRPPKVITTSSLIGH